MKFLLFRTDPSIMNVKNYNSQEIGMAKAYIAAGHSCDIVYYNGKNPTRVEQIDAGNGKYINLYWMKGFSILNNGFFLGINKLLKQYDVIQVSEYYFFASWYVYSKYSTSKKVYVYQGVYDSDNSRKYKIRCKIMDPILLNKKVLQTIPVFTKSNLAKKSMEDRGFRKVKTVGVGLDASRLIEKNTECEWVTELAAQKGDAKYLLYIGVLEDRRNILFTIDVLQKVVQELPNTKLVIVGKGKPEYSDQVFQKIRDLKLENNVIYKDALQQSELPGVYRAADMFLLPTKYEIFGMVLMEAMTFGLPVVSSYNGGSSTIIENNQNGIIVHDFDVEKWAAEIVGLLKDDIHREQITRALEGTTMDRFSWSTIVNDILEAID
ncbi:MAG: glycosyltransferase family 4 protein [Clostridia bacterium]|nr:glycosyltransferase family 4 protein [Clostridia bacterium]